MRAGWVFAVLAVALTACLEPTLLHCPNDTICPIGKVCSPLGGCVLAEQLSACTPQPSDGVCTLPGGGAGACYSGVCLAVGCGNGVVEPGERCDDGNTTPGDGCSALCDSDERCGNGLLDLTASEGCDCGDAELPDDARPLACAGEPNGDGSSARCTASCQIVGCGDGVVAGLEDCDGTNLDGAECKDAGFYTGTLACLPSCKFDTAACSGRCGDGVRDPAEPCDGVDLNGLDCTAFGFYAPEGLACNVACGIDTSACTGRCNDGVFQNGFEACDPSESAADLAFRGLDCTDFGFHAPQGLTCGASCLPDTSACGGGRCGDGIVNGDEDCDGAMLGGKTCTDFGYHVAAGLGCRDNCTYDFGDCTQRCGDNIVNGPELCDGSVPAGTDCTDFGFYNPGGLTCNASCALVTTGCTALCGDGIVNGPEECDGSLPGGLDCRDFGFYGTTGLACTGCTIDVSNCTGGTCGDSMLQAVEQCEVDVPFTVDCTDFGFYKPGGLTCLGCNFSTNRCTQRCGDSLVNGPEVCDGAPPERYQCTSLPGWSGGQLTCANACYETTDHCHKVDLQSVYPGVDAAVYDVWGIGDEMFAATGAGITRTTGGAWSPIATEASRAIWGVSTTEVYAVGAMRPGPAWNIRRYDGISWEWTTLVAPPVDLTDVFGANGVTYAVGANGTVLRRTTGPWSVVTGTGIPARTLRGVWASSDSNVIVVGDDGLRFHFDGTNWIDRSITGTTVDFTAIWGRDVDEVFATTSTGEIHTWDDATWSVTGSCGFGPVTLTGVGGLPGPSVAIAVGYDDRKRSVACQYAGGKWLPISGGRSALNGVGGSETHVAIAGDNVILVSDGATWLGMPYAIFEMDPRDAWGTSVDNLYLVGSDLMDSSEAIYRWTGGYWDAQSLPYEFGELSAIYGGTGWSVAVGFSGRILASNGSGGTWSPQTSPASEHLWDVWGDDTAVYVVGDGGTVLRRTDGVTWQPEDVGITENLRAVWGIPGGPVYAVGDNSTLLQRGGSWKKLDLPEQGLSLTSIAGRSATDIYISGPERIFHFDGNTWTRIGAFGVGGKLALTETGTFIVSSNVSELIGGRWLPLRLPQPGSGSGGFAFPDMLLIARAMDSPIALLGRTWSPTLNELSCTDEWDDDDDGRVDCADDDCSPKKECSEGGACRPNRLLRCGDMVVGTTEGGATRYPYYGGNCHARDNAGPEQYFRVVRSTPGTITVEISDFDAQSLDLIVPKMVSTACAPQEGCVAVSPDPHAATETVTWPADAGEQYMVIVDGFKGASSSFTIRVTCP